MREVGLAATEIGPEGLPTAPAEMAKVLADHDLSAVGGFAPVLLHDHEHDPVSASPILDGFAASGAEVLVLAAATGPTATIHVRNSGGEQSWKTLLTPRPNVASGRSSTLTSER